MSQQLHTFLDEWIPAQHRTGIDMHSGNTATWADACPTKTPSQCSARACAPGPAGTTCTAP
jgi:hypothetical protein